MYLFLKCIAGFLHFCNYSIRLMQTTTSYTKWFYAVVVFCLSLLLYWQTTSFDFVWDDARTHLHGNKNQRENNVGFFWTHPYEGLYAPVSYSAWYVIKKGADKKELFPKPSVFHKANVILHGINCALIFFLLAFFFGNSAAFAGALIFCCHPIQVETVAWISELRALLCALFFLTGVYLFVRKEGEKRHSVLSLVPVFIAGVFALLSKPVAIIYPVIIYFVSVLLLKQNFKKHLWFCVSMLVAFLPVAFLTSQQQPAELAEMHYPFWMRIVLPLFSLLHYIVKIIFPFSFSASYGHTPQEIQQSSFYILASLLAAALLVYFIYRKRNNKILVFSLLFFVVAIMPVSGIVPFYFQQFSSVADRFAYFPMMAVSFLAASVFAESVKSFGNKICMAAMAVVILVLVFVNYNEQKKWKNDITLWNDIVAKNPQQASAWDNLSVSYLDAGKINEALTAVEKSISINPNRHKAHLNKGNALARSERLPEAILEFDKAIELKNDMAIAYYNRALTWYQLKDFKKAKQDIDIAESLGHRIHPDFRKALDAELFNQHRQK